LARHKGRVASRQIHSHLVCSFDHTASTTPTTTGAADRTGRWRAEFSPTWRLIAELGGRFLNVVSIVYHECDVTLADPGRMIGLACQPSDHFAGGTVKRRTTDVSPSISRRVTVGGEVIT
jgi:hypothetical protein